MSTYYLAGPMRGYEEFNFPAFHSATSVLRGLGYGIISPAEMDLEMGLDPTVANTSAEGEFDVADALRRDTAAIAGPGCDGVVLLPGWEASKGANAERAFALAIGKEVWLYLSPDLPLVRPDPAPVCAEDHEVSAFATAHETVVVDAATGGRKGRKPERTDLLPFFALRLLAEHYGRGAEKYDDHNWRKGYAWSLSYGALLRHLFAWLNGEDRDPETGSLHTVAVAWHALALVEFQTLGLGTDDRWVAP